MTARSHWNPSDLIVRVLSERLQGCAPTDELRAILRAKTIHWEHVVGYASAQFVLPALGAALRDLGLIGSLDEELGGFLDAVHAANAERNAELGEELATAVRILNDAGLEPVLLKGAIRLVDDLYPDNGWRTLRDIDLLLPGGGLADAARALERVGYLRCDRDVNALWHPRSLAQIDLHRELFSTPKQVALLQAAEIIGGSRPVAVGHGSARLPSIEHQLVHLVGHSQIRHFGHACGRIAMRDRLEAGALIRKAPPESIDWQAIFARFAAAGYRRPLLIFLLSLRDDFLCAPAPVRIDPLTALQRRRIALQAHSTILARYGILVGWFITKLRSQVVERDERRPRIIATLRRLFFERGAGRRLARALLDGAPRPWQ